MRAAADWVMGERAPELEDLDMIFPFREVVVAGNRQRGERYSREERRSAAQVVKKEEKMQRHVFNEETRRYSIAADSVQNPEIR